MRNPLRGTYRDKQAISDESPPFRQISKQTALGILSEIRRILWEHWDPIGVNDEPKAFGEYDSYADGIYDLLMRGVSDDEIAQQLHSYEAVNMELHRRTNEQRMAVVKELRIVDLNPIDLP